MSAHPKSKWNRLKLFRLLVNTFLASPEPRLMHERPVRRIHQPDDSLVHMRRQIARQVSALVSLAERSQLRYRGRSLGQSRRGRIHVHPNVAVALLAEVMPGKDPLRLQFVLARQRWNLHALPAASIELPAVIAALQVLSVKPSVRERDAPVRTGIAHRKRLSLVRPSQHQGHFQQHRRNSCTPGSLRQTVRTRAGCPGADRNRASQTPFPRPSFPAPRALPATSPWPAPAPVSRRCAPPDTKIPTKIRHPMRQRIFFPRIFLLRIFLAPFFLRRTSCVRIFLLSPFRESPLRQLFPSESTGAFFSGLSSYSKRARHNLRQCRLEDML